MNDVIYNLSSIRRPLTGVGRYAIELLRAGLRLETPITAINNGQRYTHAELVTLLSHYDEPAGIEIVPSGMIQGRQRDVDTLSRKARRFIGQIPLSRQLYRSVDKRRFAKAAAPIMTGNSVCHDLNYSQCCSTKKTITTVYDLSHKVCPDTHPRHRIKYLEHYFQRLETCETSIITISSAVKNELMKHYDIAEERISAVPLAASPSFRPMQRDECSATLRNYSLNYKQYLLCVGTLEPRKNLNRVLDAYESLDNTLKQQFPLVVVGPEGWKSANLEQKLRRLERTGNVIRLNFVPQAYLPTLYAGATAFIYPSLYEGFGLPLLEAMQSGCPSISSNDGALNEVAAGQAISVDPRDTTEIAEKLTHLLNNTDLHAKLRDSGIHRATHFSWDITAQRTHEIYHAL